MVAVPGATAVTTPAGVTTATEESLVVHPTFQPSDGAGGGEQTVAEGEGGEPTAHAADAGNGSRDRDGRDTRRDGDDYGRRLPSSRRGDGGRARGDRRERSG